jgi:HlyD family secretion protein
MKRILPILLIVALAVAAYYLYPRWFGKHANPGEMKLSGNIEAHESLVSFKVTGRVVDLPVEEGQAMQAGQLLAKLDNADYRQQVSVDEANTHVRGRQLTLALAGARSEDIEAARQNVVDAQADLAQKKQDLARYDALLAKDEIPAQTRDQAATAVTRAETNVARLRQVYDELLAGTRKEEIAVDQANVSAADKSLGMSQIKLGYTTLTAPFSGVVLVREAELGEVVSPGTPIVTLADLQHLWVRVYIAETDLGKIHLDEDVTVRTDSFPNKTYQGRISFISSEAEFTPKSVQTQAERVTLVYRVKVDVGNPNNELKPGMPADVYIETK